MSPTSKVPFLFLLIPFIAGIVLQYYGQNITWSILFFLSGGIIILLSFLWKKVESFTYRWIFGLSLAFLLIGIGGGRTYTNQDSLRYNLVDSTRFYVGYITETPQEKPRSVAHKIHLVDENVNIVCYLAKDSSRLPLEVGDEIAFLAELQPFKNMGNPDDFDYERYMYNQGFVASTYLSNASWAKTGKSHFSFRTQALKIRQGIMDVYSSLGFSPEEQAILSALTLGYQDTLSDDLKQAFRTTGTVHVLSVSGLHVGIVYIIIAFSLSFIRPSSRFHRLRPIFTIFLLWLYAFVTGLPASVVRASIMLSVFCLAELFGRKNSSLNTLCIAAFGMLIYNPFWLFDIGFQLSFVSVLSILALYKRMAKWLDIKNKVLHSVWQMFTISVVAQLATFPLCLYYFGTFPTYFFVANLIIVPFVSLIIYGIGLVFLAWGVATLIPQYMGAILWLPMKGEQLLVSLMTKFVYLFEHLPFALIEGINLSFMELVVIYCIIIGLLYSLANYKSKVLILSLALTVFLLTIHIQRQLSVETNRLTVFNRQGVTDVVLFLKDKEIRLADSLFQSRNPVLRIDDNRVLFVDDILRDNLLANEKYNVDYAIITQSQELSLDELERYFNVSNVVLDSSLSPWTKQRLTKECEKKDIPLHDVTKKGAFTIFFTTFAG